LRPHELIIIDVFPRVLKTGYHGDMTRTYLKGRPREVQRRLVETVREAQKRATRTIRAGVDGREVHAACTRCFAEAGYETKRTKNGAVGFFHGTGHGLGLAVHDPGRMSPTIPHLLKKGSVMTVEPGLYYPGLGGCRWEDVVWVTASGSQPLSKHPYHWEIR
jgi:Xaa-Pro aminopeptidase